MALTPKKRGRKPKAATEKKADEKTPLKEVNNIKEAASNKKPARSKLENKFTEMPVQTKESCQGEKTEKVLTRAQRAKLNLK